MWSGCVCSQGVCVYSGCVFGQVSGSVERGQHAPSVSGVMSMDMWPAVKMLRIISI